MTDEIMKEKFNPAGYCEKCGQPLGRLKNVTLSDYGHRPLYTLIDIVLYHMSPFMTETRIGCPEISPAAPIAQLSNSLAAN